ncbi:MAG: four helix bundle protein [Firmicutes bacterium]|nr:four helix bundle protein [Bacillota bacterium]
MRDNVVKDKSFKFAIRVVNLYKYLSEDKREFILSKQLLKSATSVGANVAEAQHATSKKDFANKMAIASKEANETKYWLELLRETDYLTDEQFDSIYKDCIEIVKLLVSIVKNSNTSK